LRRHDVISRAASTRFGSEIFLQNSPESLAFAAPFG
jgi:hypothetical protein